MRYNNVNEFNFIYYNNKCKKVRYRPNADLKVRSNIDKSLKTRQLMRRHTYSILAYNN